MEGTLDTSLKIVRKGTSMYRVAVHGRSWLFRNTPTTRPACPSRGHRADCVSSQRWWVWTM